MPPFTLEELAATIAARAQSGDAGSYTAKLAGEGVGRCVRKLGEEAVETMVAAMEGDRGQVTREAADLIYHLLVLLQVTGVTLEDVKAELAHRTGTSGLAEKAARGAGGAA
jgi:phosphoribosyl-ATP pyrophosphohydrolase